MLVGGPELSCILSNGHHSRQVGSRWQDGRGEHSGVGDVWGWGEIVQAKEGVGQWSRLPLYPNTHFQPASIILGYLVLRQLDLFPLSRLGHYGRNPE